MPMNIKDFVSSALGDIPNELAHSMSMVFHQKIMQFFEETDNPEVMKLREFKFTGFGGKEITAVDLILRVIGSMLPEELEFEIETPCSISGDTDGDGDVEISFNKKGLFKEQSHIKIRMLMKKAELPEGLAMLIDEQCLKLHRQLDS